MEIKIGIQNTARELVVESDQGPDDVEQAVTQAVSNQGVLTLRDTKGRTVVVPAAKLAYVEIGSSSIGAVGFRS